MKKKQDVFDQIMGLPIFAPVYPFYEKHKEVLLYLLFGGLSFILNISFFFFLNGTLKINELISNVISWIVCVLFQFFTNRTWVFQNDSKKSSKFLKQLIDFFGGRIATLIVEECILVVFITWLAFDALCIKILAQVIVILLNYIISKWFVFA